MNNFSKIEKNVVFQFFSPKFHLKPNGAGSLFHGTLVEPAKATGSMVSPLDGCMYVCMYVCIYLTN